MVTNYDVAVNPHEPDLPEALKAADYISLKITQESRGIAYSIIGESEEVQFIGRIVGIVEIRDDTIVDVVRRLKPFEFAEQFKSYLLLKTEWFGFLSDSLHK